MYNILAKHTTNLLHLCSQVLFQHYFLQHGCGFINLDRQVRGEAHHIKKHTVSTSDQILSNKPSGMCTMSAVMK